MKNMLLVVATLAWGACKDKTAEPSDPGGASPAKTAPAGGGGDGDCAKYAALMTKCAGAGDTAQLEMMCKTTLKSNNAMSGSMKAQVACATSNDACDAYAKCLATP